jgi:uncharacterized protein
MDVVRSVLAKHGVPDERVHHERYTSGVDATATITTPQEMVVEDGAHAVGTVVVEPGRTLLDARAVVRQRLLPLGVTTALAATSR